MPIVERLLGKISFLEFEKEYFGKNPYSAALTGHDYRGILSWHLLCNILENHSDCWIAKKGELLADMNIRGGRVTFADAIKSYKKGATILVRHSEMANSQLWNIGEDFQRFFKAPVDIQLYFTPAEAQGFDWHYDLEDVFIVQSVGMKEFRLRKNTVSEIPLDVSKMQNDFLNERGGSEIRCLLNAGDFLYIPAGWWHCAHAVTDSAHLSVGVLGAAKQVADLGPQQLTFASDGSDEYQSCSYPLRSLEYDSR
jgi:50S ribosomal protein L16 3-hydroxylase